MARRPAPFAPVLVVAGALVVLLAVLVVLGAVLLARDLDTADKAASVVAAAVTIVVAAVALVGWWRRGSVHPDAGPAEPVDRLRAHLGRRAELPLLGEVGATALALRVHPSVDGGAGSPAPVVDEVGRTRRWSARLRRGPAGPDPEHMDLPAFVPRDQQPSIEHWMRRAAVDGGMLMLVGDSAVGKSRMLYETARKVLPDFRVLAPALGDGALVEELTRAKFRLPKLMIWLDETHRFLPGPYLSEGSTPLTAGVVSTLLDGPTPVVIVGSCWPEHQRELRASTHQVPVASRARSAEQMTEDEQRRPDDDLGTGTPPRRDRHPGAADVLRRCHEITVHSFSAAERAAAEKLASTDRRLEVALEYRDFNVTEVLAGAPELIRRYERGTPEVRAVLKAAVDATRLGVESALTGDVLRRAARGYLDSVQPDDRWFDPALAELTRRDRSTAPLIPVLDEDRHAVVGHRVTDYVHQQLGHERRRQRVPDTLWRALLDSSTDPGDLQRLVHSAGRRGLLGYVARLTRMAVEAGHQDAPDALRVLDAWHAGDVLELPEELDEERADLLSAFGDLAILRALADAGSWHATHELCGILMQRGDDRELRQRSGHHALSSLCEFLEDRGAVHDLRQLADASESVSEPRSRLAHLLSARAMTAELAARADAGDIHAQSSQVDLVLWRQDWHELRRRAGREEYSAPASLAAFVTMRAEIDKLRVIVDSTGASWAREALAFMLVDRDELGELRSRADSGDDEARDRLVEVLLARGIPHELSDRAAGGDWVAANEYAIFLARRGDLAELRRRSQSADSADAATHVLADVLVATEEHDELRDLEVPGGPVARRYVEFLGRRGELDELETRARSGDDDAAEVLADLLVRRSDADAVRALAGDLEAVRRRQRSWHEDSLPGAELDELRRLAEQGDAPSCSRLSAALAARGDLEELRRLSAEHESSRLAHIRLDLYDRFSDFRGAHDSETSHFSRALVDLLAARGEIDELYRLATTNESDRRVAARVLVEVLVDRADLTRLRALVDHGDYFAHRALAAKLMFQDDIDQLGAFADSSHTASQELLKVLIARGHIDAIRARADAEVESMAGDDANSNAPYDFAEGYADLLANRHDVEQLRTRSAAGDRPCGHRLAWILAATGDFLALREAAANCAAMHEFYLAALVVTDNWDEFAELANDGDPDAREALRTMLADVGDVAELAAIAESGDLQAADRLDQLLRLRGDLDALRRRTDSGDRFAAALLFDMLRARGETAELRDRAEAGDTDAAERLAPLLSVAGDVDGLCREIDAGTSGAVGQLAILLDERDPDLAASLRRYGITPSRPASLDAIATAPVLP